MAESSSNESSISAKELEESIHLSSNDDGYEEKKQLTEEEIQSLAEFLDFHFRTLTLGRHRHTVDERMQSLKEYEDYLRNGEYPARFKDEPNKKKRKGMQKNFRRQVKKGLFSLETDDQVLFKEIKRRSSIGEYRVQVITNYGQVSFPPFFSRSIQAKTTDWHSHGLYICIYCHMPVCRAV